MVKHTIYILLCDENIVHVVLTMYLLYVCYCSISCFFRSFALRQLYVDVWAWSLHSRQWMYSHMLFCVVLHMRVYHLIACSNITVGINHHNTQCIYISVPHCCGYPIDEKQNFFALYHGSGDINTAHKYKCHTDVYTMFFAEWRKTLSVCIVIVHHSDIYIYIIYVTAVLHWHYYINIGH